MGRRHSPSGCMPSIAGLVLLLSLSWDISAQADLDAGLETLLRESAGDELVSVIVRLSGGVDMDGLRQSDRRVRREAMLRVVQDRAAQRRAPLVAYLAARGLAPQRHLWLVNGVSATLPARIVANLARFPGVESITLDYKIRVLDVAGGGSLLAETNLHLVRATDLWDLGYRGDGIVVAGMDTGVDMSHPDLSAQWRGGSNSWFDPNNQHPDAPVDVHGHGTQTMGVLVGRDAGGSAIGVAPDAQWIAVKIFNDAGEASLSAIHAGFQWLLDPDGDPTTDDAPDVVNNSWGLVSTVDQCVTEFDADVHALKTAGIAVVFAAGNEAPLVGPRNNTSISPANGAAGYAVGSVDMALAIAPTSSQGPGPCDAGVFPEMVAPGVGIVTADPCFGPLCSYVTVSGTSFAAPHVAGVMALLLNAFPQTGVQEMEAALGQSAVDLGEPGPDNIYGYGLVDALAAYERLRCPPDSVDSDGDGVVDACDNCTLVANPGQSDQDGDGYGNQCDGDYNNNGMVDFQDAATFRQMLGGTDPGGDFNSNGSVDFQDLAVFRAMIGYPPGPSASAGL